MEKENEVFKTRESEYGGHYKEHLLEQYKLYVEMMDRVSERRQHANNFFLGINTALIGATGFLFKNGEAEPPLVVVALVAAAGIIISYGWYRALRSYKDLNSGKFKIIHEIEKRLPLALFDAEWTALGRGENSKLYLPFTHIEIWIPRIFMALYAVLLILRFKGVI